MPKGVPSLLAQLQDGSVKYDVLVHSLPNEEMQSFFKRIQRFAALQRVPRVSVAWASHDGSSMLQSEPTIQDFKVSRWLLGKRSAQGNSSELLVCPDGQQSLKENITASPSELSKHSCPSYHTQGQSPSQRHHHSSTESLPR